MLKSTTIQDKFHAENDDQEGTTLAYVTLETSSITTLSTITKSYPNLWHISLARVQFTPSTSHLLSSLTKYAALGTVDLSSTNVTLHQIQKSLRGVLILRLILLEFNWKSVYEHAKSISVDQQAEIDDFIMFVLPDTWSFNDIPKTIERTQSLNKYFLAGKGRYSDLMRKGFFIPFDTQSLAKRNATTATFKRSADTSIHSEHFRREDGIWNAYSKELLKHSMPRTVFEDDDKYQWRLLKLSKDLERRVAMIYPTSSKNMRKNGQVESLHARLLKEDSSSDCVFRQERRGDEFVSRMISDTATKQSERIILLYLLWASLINEEARHDRFPPILLQKTFVLFFDLEDRVVNPLFWSVGLKLSFCGLLVSRIEMDRSFDIEETALLPSYKPLLQTVKKGVSSYLKSNYAFRHAHPKIPASLDTPLSSLIRIPISFDNYTRKTIYTQLKSNFELIELCSLIPDTLIYIQEFYSLWLFYLRNLEELKNLFRESSTRSIYDFDTLFKEDELVRWNNGDFDKSVHGVCSLLEIADEGENLRVKCLELKVRICTLVRGLIVEADAILSDD